MPVELALSIVAPILKGKGDIRNCSCYRAVKLLKHGMKVVERVLVRGESSLSSTTLVVKQSQFHCRIVRQCLFCSGI